MTQVLRRMRPPCLPATGDMTSAVAGLVCAGLLLMTTVHAGHPRGVSSHRQRRSLMNLSSMVSEITGRKGSDFIAYGNWCGLGGSGRPIDPVDQCCQVHDICYNLASKGSCRAAGEKGVYQIEYKWKKGKDGNPSCDEESDHCKSSICMCDAVLTECLEKNLESYDSQNLHKLSLYELLQEANWLSNR